jgi:rod shape-determining protein MreD
MQKRFSSPNPNQSSIVLKSLPSVMLLLVTLFTMAELPLPFAGRTNPLFTIIAIFYLSLWQPLFISIWVTFAAGLLFDVYQPTPLGTYALLFLLMRQMTCKIRNHTAFIAKPFAAWWRFSLLAIIFFACEWGFASALLGYNIFSSNFLWRCCITMLIYPVIHSIFSSIIASVQAKF